MTNKALARLLKETAALIELTGGNPFRGRAFSSAARTLERLDDQAVDLLRAGTLTQVPGIGQGLAAQIAEAVARGSFGLRDDLLNAIPPGLLDVLRIKGLGAKKVRRLWQALGITSLEDLEQVALTGQVASLDGFGAKSQEQILVNLKRLRAYSARRRYADAFLQAEALCKHLQAEPGIVDVSMAGALRRALETVAEAEVVVAAGDASVVVAAAQAWLEASPTPQPLPCLLRGHLPDGLPLVLHVVPPATYGTTLWQLTGSEVHCQAFIERFGAPDDYAHEYALYEAAQIAFIPPALRETEDSLDQAATGALPQLLTVQDLRGCLHNHSTYSDGAHSLADMAAATRARGLSYLGICDHSRSLVIANGMSIERVAQQQAEIAALNEQYRHDGGPPFRIFSGIESDILADGALDYPDDVLASFDLVVASIHSGFNMTEAQATERLIKAIENPYTTILGHPTGRLLLAREGYPIDHTAVIAACAAHGVALELNANPYRLDVDWRWLQEARAQGVLVAINPDAHAMDQIDYMRWGVAVAQKGALTPDGCLNAMPLEAFTNWLAGRRQPA